MSLFDWPVTKSSGSWRLPKIEVLLANKETYYCKFHEGNLGKDFETK
jgi:hypothetical protein